MARILVVDDEDGIRSFLAEALRDEGHEVDTAEDGLAALARLHERAFDLMITDLRMPGSLDGIDLLRRAKADQPEMEVIVLTAFGSVGSAVEAMRLGAYDYLQKPLASPEELRMMVRRALERRRLVSARDAAERQEETLPPLTYGDPVMEPVVRSIERVAPTPATVLLRGESGTGKEIAARTIHRLSQASKGPFLAVNCAAISESLMESEIFGHEKGAFTGAVAARRGRLELAEGGSFFLDEVGELKLELQAKLLRVLQERRFERVGGTRTLEANVRWIAATHRDLQEMVREGAFRADLFHRLSVFPIEIPPLRDRRRDLPLLAEALLARISAQLGRPPLRLEDAAKDRILGARWSGNVRELANTLERAAILADGEVIRAAELWIPEAGDGHGGAAETIADLEREAIRRALQEVGGNRKRAAERLGIGVRTLYDKLRRYGLE
jgi:two-component system, NtrC family, response regulator AtoC